ncbi:MAG: Gfo/Idh/MocA family oxidoreductase [Pyrinomonadaceae bacterium]|nr:Gfo/Idh/MocA family oxidoreductase [Pyrinomonadaceae bacterium]MBA3765582.1 Gfo/Idh/MocA family oxidoreductase [Acidobacteriota bacterium]
MIRLALLGCGEHSRSSHAAPLARYAAQNPGDIELVAACDLNLDRAREFCREFGFARAYSDVETMLTTELVDGCVCVLPMDCIVELAVMLLERKIPCVIEKPLGISPQESERLADVTRQTGTPHMVSVNRRFMPYLNQAKSWAKDIGPLQYVRATQVRHARDEPDFIWSTAIHVLDALRHLAGEVVGFDTEVHRQAGLSTVWYVVTLRFESGTRGRTKYYRLRVWSKSHTSCSARDFELGSSPGQGHNAPCNAGALDKWSWRNTPRRPSLKTCATARMTKSLSLCKP